MHASEQYLIHSPYKNRCIVVQFRARSKFLSVHIIKLYDFQMIKLYITHSDIKCLFYKEAGMFGDESYFLLSCEYFDETISKTNGDARC